MEFQVGQKVMVNPDSNDSNSSPMGWNNEMNRFKGKITTIKKRYGTDVIPTYDLDLEGSENYYWQSSMLLLMDDEPEEQDYEEWNEKHFIKKFDQFVI